MGRVQVWQTIAQFSIPVFGSYHGPKFFFFSAVQFKICFHAHYLTFSTILTGRDSINPLYRGGNWGPELCFNLPQGLGHSARTVASPAQAFSTPPPHAGLSRPLGIQIGIIKQGSCPQGTCGPTQTYICVQLQSHFNFNKGKNKLFGDSKDGGTLSGMRERSPGATEWRTQLLWVSGLTSVPQIFAQLMVKNPMIQILGQSHLGGRDGGKKWREEGSKQLWNLYTFHFVLIIEKTILKGDWGILGD